MITINPVPHNPRSYLSRLKIKSKYPFRIITSHPHKYILCSFDEVKPIFNELFDKYWAMIHEDNYLPSDIDITCRTKEQTKLLMEVYYNGIFLYVEPIFHFFIPNDGSLSRALALFEYDFLTQNEYNFLKDVKHSFYRKD